MTARARPRVSASTSASAKSRLDPHAVVVGQPLPQRRRDEHRLATPTRRAGAPATACSTASGWRRRVCHPTSARRRRSGPLATQACSVVAGRRPACREVRVPVDRAEPPAGTVGEHEVVPGDDDPAAEARERVAVHDTTTVPCAVAGADHRRARLGRRASRALATMAVITAAVAAGDRRSAAAWRRDRVEQARARGSAPASPTAAGRRDRRVAHGDHSARGELEVVGRSSTPPRDAHRVDDRVADRSVEQLGAASTHSREHRRRDLAARTTRPGVIGRRPGSTRSPSGFISATSCGGLVGQAACTRPPTGSRRRARSTARCGEPCTTEPAALGERGVAGGGGGWTDASRGPTSRQRAGRGDVGEARRCPADRDQRLGPIGAGPQDDRDEVTAEAALRRQQHRLGERRGDGGVVRVAARRAAASAPARAASGAAAHTTPSRPRPVHCSAITAAAATLSMTLSSRRVSSAVSRLAAHRGRARSGCARRSTVLVRPARCEHDRRPPRPVEACAVLGDAGRRPPGSDRTASSPSGDSTTCESSTSEAEVLDRRPDRQTTVRRSTCVAPDHHVGARAERRSGPARTGGGRRAMIDGRHLGAPVRQPVAHGTHGTFRIGRRTFGGGHRIPLRVTACVVGPRRRARRPSVLQAVPVKYTVY